MATQALNPDWVEWLMGWPMGWTDLEPIDMSAWQAEEGSWWDVDPADDGAVPRTSTGRKDRVNRLKSIGNGQVPQAARLAWGLLSGDWSE